jgi:hypothetical protein
MQSVELLRLLSGIVVVGFCAFLIGLAVVIATAPLLAERFLKSFASSAQAHYTEQGLRLLAGAALVNFAGSMWHRELFQLLGWLMVVTAAVLLVTPWQWHHKFGTWVMPLVIRRMWIFALGAAALGAFILYGASRAVTE